MIMKAGSYTLGKWAMPPSSNHQYFSRIMPGKGLKKDGTIGKNAGKMVSRQIKSTSLQQWEMMMDNWFLANDRKMKEARMFTLEIQARQMMVRWDTYLCWPHPGLWFQNGQPARNDLHDRLKAQHDKLSKQMGFDDRRIFASYEEKVELRTIADPFFFIVLSPHKPRFLDEIKFGDVPR